MTNYDCDCGGCDEELPYCVSFSNGDADAAFETLDEAKEIFEGDDCEYGDWDADGYDALGRAIERMLVWASAADAEGDSGAKAIASIRRVAE